MGNEMQLGTSRQSLRQFQRILDRALAQSPMLPAKDAPAVASEQRSPIRRRGQLAEAALETRCRAVQKQKRGIATEFLLRRDLGESEGIYEAIKIRFGIELALEEFDRGERARFTRNPASRRRGRLTNFNNSQNAQ